MSELQKKGKIISFLNKCKALYSRIRDPKRAGLPRIPFYAIPGRGKIKLRGDTVIIGPRLTGKSVLAMKLAFEDDRSGIITNVNINEERFNALRLKRGLPPKKIQNIEHPREFFDRHCWYRWLDEAQKFFPARGYKDADQQALAAVAEERKDDAWTAYTVQALRNLDVLVAAFADNIVRVKLKRLPFIGWIWPNCVRPTQLCRHTDAEPKEHCRRDSAGDQSSTIGKLFGVGSLIVWSVIDPELIVKQRTLDGSAQLEPGAQEPGVIGKGWTLFDVEVADLFDSGQKIAVAPPGANAPKGAQPAIIGKKDDPANFIARARQRLL